MYILHFFWPFLNTLYSFRFQSVSHITVTEKSSANCSNQPATKLHQGTITLTNDKLVSISSYQTETNGSSNQNWWYGPLKRLRICWPANKISNGVIALIMKRQVQAEMHVSCLIWIYLLGLKTEPDKLMTS